MAGAAALPALAQAEGSAATAWPWAFAALAAAALLVVAWLAWRLGRAQAAAPVQPPFTADAADTAQRDSHHAPRAQHAPAGTRSAGAATPAHESPANRHPAVAGLHPSVLMLARMLDLHAGAALLLLRPDGGPTPAVFRHLNAAAVRLLPEARAGEAAEPALAQLSAMAVGAESGALAAGTAALLAGGRAQVGAWQLASVGVVEGLGELIVLQTQPDAATPTPPAPAQAPTDAPNDAETEQFSFTLSHDLRAPIRVVEGFTRIVKEDYGALLDRVGNDHLDRVLGAAARMNLMIDALLTLARLSRQPLSRQNVNLSQLAQWVSEELRRGAPDREVRFEIEPGLQAMGDPTLLRLVLENLLGNAWKYSCRNERSHIRFARVTHANAPAYLVQDNGAGFDMRGADRLFGLFQRLHSASEFPGTGVGLASVRRIVQRHGGQIWADAEPGRGASFYFTLADS